MKNTDILHKRLLKIDSVLDTEYLINQVEDESQIFNYYNKNKLSYQIFHNRDAFLHMGISRDGKYKHDDLLEPAKEIAEYIRKLKAQNVLELATGRGANINYLANEFPNINFVGIDLSTKPLNKYSHHSNIDFRLGDFHDLSKFENNSLDVVYVIEALSHSDDKEKVLTEVYSKLKKDGVFIIYDGYQVIPDNELNKEEIRACVLTSKGMAVNKFESIFTFETTISKVGFNILDKEDLSSYVLPTMKRFELLAKGFFKLKYLAKFLNIFLPEMFVRNSLSGYLMPVLIEGKIAKYYKHILQK